MHFASCHGLKVKLCVCPLWCKFMRFHRLIVWNLACFRNLLFSEIRIFRQNFLWFLENKVRTHSCHKSVIDRHNGLTIVYVFVDCCVESCENRVVLWKPGSHTSELHSMASKHSSAEPATAVSVLHQFDFANCDIWFMRFAMDHGQKVEVHACMLLCVIVIVIATTVFMVLSS